MDERPCSYTVADLRKAITSMRKQKGFNAPSKGVLDNLLDSHRFLLHAEGIHDVGALLGGTIKQKRAVWKRIKEKYHPPVGSMTSAQCTQLIYATNKHLKYNYDPKLRAFTEKKMITKACRASSPPDFKSLASADALGKTKHSKAPPALALDLDDDLDIDDVGERQGKRILEDSDEEMSDFDDTPPTPPVRRKAKPAKVPFKELDVDTLNYVQFAAYIRRLREHHGKSKPKQEQLSRWWKLVKEKKEGRAREAAHASSMKASDKQARALERQSQRAQRDKSKADRRAADKADRVASQRTDLGKIPKKKAQS